MTKEIEQIKEKINHAQMLLIGIGEELDGYRLAEKSDAYKEWQEKVQRKELLPFILRELVKQHRSEQQEFYADLKEFIGEKNHFIVSICRDDAIMQSEINQERIVTPCGGFRYMQCPQACEETLYLEKEVASELEMHMKQYMLGERAEDMVQLPVCPVCGRPLVFNTVKADHYLETGYLSQWSLYMKWLQGTLNRELCVLELGVGMSYPTVIRWPFEKTVFINQKAYLYRVHSSLYQITEEVAGKAEGICAQPTEFLKELSKEK